MKMKLDMNPEYNPRKQVRWRIPLAQINGRIYGDEVLWGYHLGTGNVPQEQKALEIAKKALLRALSDVEQRLNELTGPAVSGKQKT